MLTVGMFTSLIIGGFAILTELCDRNRKRQSNNTNFSHNSGISQDFS